MSEIIAEGILPVEDFQAWIDTYTPLVSEGKVHFNDDGLTARLVDPANIAMIDPGTLKPGAFESYESPGAVTVGFNFNRVDERLGGAKKGDLVHLAVDMETRHLRINYRNIEHTVAMIDPDSIRQEPDTPDLDLPNTVTLSGGDLSEAVEQADLVSDHMEIRADPDTREVVFFAQGDTDDMEITHDDETLGDPTRVTEDTSSLYSIDYLESITSPIPDESEVTLTFGSDYPLLLDWSAADGYMDVHQLLAPRIQSH